MTTLILFIAGFFFYALVLIGFILFFKLIHECDNALRKMMNDEGLHKSPQGKKAKKNFSPARA
ncbi:MAG: hypothetical protein HY562_09275 [Ignavibacteriales bacterium]|nr:hypothetical protein [Ignavibacteriales bacterium]